MKKSMENTVKNTALECIENVPTFFPSEAITPQLEVWLGERYGHLLAIQPPSFQTDGRWRLMSRGWIGQIPLPDGRLLVLKPKVPIQNVFAMLALVYDLAAVTFLDGRFPGREIAEFYDFLAEKLLDGIHQRLRRGIYRAYQPRRDRQAAVRGRIDFPRMSHHPEQAYPICEYQEQTADNVHNQLLAWTLYRMGNAPFFIPDIPHRARLLARRLPVTLRPFSSSEISRLTYNRLNEDYSGLHRLCRFFLDQIGPTHHAGQRPLTPFLLSMPALFERFVARWLADHLPNGWRLEQQVAIDLELYDYRSRQLKADLLIFDDAGKIFAVVDTKYKSEAEPEMADIYQVTFYAHQLGCPRAFLIYPFLPHNRAVSGKNQGVVYRSAVFDIGQDLTQSGQNLLRAILGQKRID